MFIWILSLMVAASAAEAPAPWREQYPEIALAIAQAAEADPLPGKFGKSHMGAVLVAIAWHESRFRPDPKLEGDAGASLGPWQLSRGWHAPRDIQGQAIFAARLVRESWSVCRDRPIDEKLSWYVYGRSGCEHRWESSRIRMGLAKRLLAKYPRQEEETE